MPVSSPYALFRAADLLWPALPSGPFKEAPAGGVRTPPAEHWPRVIQGELFPCEGSCRPRRSTARRSSP